MQDDNIMEEIPTNMAKEKIWHGELIGAYGDSG